jgi:hypothetical protein
VSDGRLQSIDWTLTLIAVVLAIALIKWRGDVGDASDCESEHHHHWTGHSCRRDDGTLVETP